MPVELSTRENIPIYRLKTSVSGLCFSAIAAGRDLLALKYAVAAVLVMRVNPLGSPIASPITAIATRLAISESESVLKLAQIWRENARISSN